MQITRTRWFAYASLLLAMMLWASSYIALKIAFRSYDPMVVIFGRMSVASLCFLFIIKRLKGRGYQKGSLKYILFMVFCEPCLYFIFEAKALENTSASQAGIIAAMLPLLVAVTAHFFLKEIILPTRIEPVATIAVIYLGAIITTGAYGLYNFGVSRIPVSQATAFINLIPVFTVFLGWLILDESLTLLQYAASVLIFAGIFISQERAKKTAA